MAENEHTPGPWNVDLTDDYGTYRIHEAAREQNEWALEGYGQKETDAEKAEGKRRNEIASLHDEGNRRLIQAAPDMLRALEAVHRWQYGEDEGNEDKVLDIMADAIEKARGR
ncbi:MAG: hypothetical protein NTY36_16265 [Deltaproteobacteria bacterium]|nr:hypothetical protein [Deltaproteobacteria bacterium]